MEYKVAISKVKEYRDYHTKYLRGSLVHMMTSPERGEGIAKSKWLLWQVVGVLIVTLGRSKAFLQTYYLHAPLSNFSANNPWLPLPSGAQHCEHRKSPQQNDVAPRQGFDLQRESTISRRGTHPTSSKPGKSMLLYIEEVVPLGRKSEAKNCSRKYESGTYLRF